MDDWDDIRFFLSVVQNGNVTAAANALGVNHSTVSRRVQAFEKKHNVRLFERMPTGYVMTPSAESILKKAQEIEQRTHDIERDLFGRDDRLQGKVVVTAPSFVVNKLLMPHVSAFIKKFPDIQFYFHTTSNVKNMAAREADIAVRLTPQPSETLIGRQIATLCQGVYTSKKYWKQNQNTKDVILWNDESTLPDWVQKNFPNARVVLRADTVATMVEAVKEGLGIAHMPCIIGELQESLFRIELTLPPPSWGVWVLNHVDLRSTARIRVVKEFLLETLGNYKPHFEGEKSQYI